jgi:hypothetical protein
MEIKQELKSGIHLVTLSGAVDESTSDMESLRFDGPKEVEFNCRDISRVTSIGIMRWVKFFKTLREQGLKLRFAECSPTIIRQGSMLLTGFLKKDEIVSVGLPFFCDDCRLETISYNDVKTLEANKFEVPEVNCKNCGNPAEFDDVPELYFQIFEEEDV